MDTDKYKTRKEFREKSASAYTKSHQKNIIDELFKNHPNQGYKYPQK